VKKETIGDATLYCGDCLEILPTLGPPDAMITDPPYGINHSSAYGASWMNTKIQGDESIALRDKVIDGFCNSAGCFVAPIAYFGTWKTGPVKDIPHRGALIWNKGPAFGMGDLSFPWKQSWEIIYCVGPGWESNYREEGVISGHLCVSWESKGRTHPHQKPVSLIEYLINRLPNKEIIIDPFMGSGTTGVACINLGRKFIGIEIEPKYFDIACERIQLAWESRPRLFEEEEKKVRILEMDFESTSD